MAPEVPDEVAKVIRSGWVGQGPVVDQFEDAIGQFLRVPTEHIVTVNSCTSALQLALRLAGVGPGDEVISTPATNLATNMTILQAGASIVWADVDPRTGRVRPDTLPSVRESTKALMVMDFGGTVCDLASLSSFCHKHNIKLIVDAAHSFGATYDSRHQYYWADYVCHSFQAVKTLSTWDGGALICKDRKDADRARKLRWFSLDRVNTTPDDPRCLQQDVHEWGYKAHLHDVAAACGLVNIKYTKELIEKQRANAAYYDKFFDKNGIGHITVPEDRKSSYWLYTLLLNGQGERGKLAERLKFEGIGCSIVHARNDAHSLFKTFSRALPGVDEFYRTQLSIPVGHWLTEEDRSFVAESVKNILCWK